MAERFRLDQAIAKKIARDDENPFNLSGHPGSLHLGVYRALEGLSPELQQKTLEAIESKLSTIQSASNPHGELFLDPVMANLLAHRGIDPIAATWIGLLGGAVDIEDNATGDIAACLNSFWPPSPHDIASMVDFPGVFVWYVSGELTATIPEMIKPLLPGMPLEKIVSHRAFEGWNIHITRTKDESLFTDYEPRPATLDELAQARSFLKA